MRKQIRGIGQAKSRGVERSLGEGGSRGEEERMIGQTEPVT